MLTTHLRIGGIAVYVTSLAKALTKRGDRVIAVSSGGDMTDELTKAGISHIELDIQTKSELSPKLWLALPELAAIIKKEKPDVIHAHTRVTQVLAALLAKRFKIPYISTCHGFFRPRLSRRLLGCWGEVVIAISEAVREHLKKDFGVNEKRIELIHNGVDIKRFNKQFSKEEVDQIKRSFGLGPEPVIGTIGRLSPVKGFGDLISAFGNTSFLREKANLVIVGNGPDKMRLVNFTDKLKVKKSVRFIDSSLDTPRLLSIMDVFVFPSIQEGLGLSLIEALASGRAVVATDVGGIRSLIRDNETGLLARKGDRNDLARAINRLLDDGALRKKLAQNGRELVRNEYTMEKMADKTGELYKFVIARRPFACHCEPPPKAGAKQSQ